MKKYSDEERATMLKESSHLHGKALKEWAKQRQPKVSAFSIVEWRKDKGFLEANQIKIIPSPFAARGRRGKSKKTKAVKKVSKPKSGIKYTSDPDSGVYRAKPEEKQLNPLRIKINGFLADRYAASLSGESVCKRGQDALDLLVEVMRADAV